MNGINLPLNDAISQIKSGQIHPGMSQNDPPLYLNAEQSFALTFCPPDIRETDGGYTRCCHHPSYLISLRK